MMLYEWLNGKPPFTGEDPLAVAFQHIDQPLPPLTMLSPTLSSTLDQVIQCALDRNPDRRYQTAGKLVAAYKRVLRVIEEEVVVDTLPEHAYSLLPAVLHLPLRSEIKVVSKESSEGTGYRQGLLSGTTKYHRVSDMPTIHFITPHDKRLSESGGWQLRPPIITDQMAAIKSSTGSKSPISAYPPLPAALISEDQERAMAPLSTTHELSNQPVGSMNIF